MKILIGMTILALTLLAANVLAIEPYQLGATADIRAETCGIGAIDPSAIAFGPLAPEATGVSTPDHVTVPITGDAYSGPADYITAYISGTGWDDGFGSAFGVEQTSWSLDSSTWTQLQSSTNPLDSGLNPGDSILPYFQLTVPLSANPSNNYAQTITFTASCD